MTTLGVQTFTVRKEQKKSIRGAYLPLIKMGIRAFEVARISFNKETAEEIRTLEDEFGIEVTSIQVKPKYVFGDPEGIIEFCRITRCPTVVISMLPFKCIFGGERKIYDFISSLDAACEIYENAGITLAYHHHDWEYSTLKNGERILDEILKISTRVKLILDTYWTARCGIDPALLVERLGGRVVGLHLRDMKLDRRGMRVTPRSCVLGEGVVDVARVIDNAMRVGCPYLAIEIKTNDPFGDIEKSYLYSKEIADKRSNLCQTSQ